jgi:hypothetical protein
MNEDDSKLSKDESKRPGATQWMKSKKERVGEDVFPRIPVSQFLAPPKTPTASKLRKEAQAKALAAEKVVAVGAEAQEEQGVEEEEIKIKKKRRMEYDEEEEMEQKEAKAVLKQQEEDFEDIMLEMEESRSECESTGKEYSGDPRRAKEEWLRAWLEAYDVPASNLSLYERSTLLPIFKGVTVSGTQEANEILVVGDIGRDNIDCAVGHILFLIQNGRKFRTTFNTIEGYRIRVEEGDITLEKVLLISIDPVVFAVEGESSYLLPDVNDPGWRVIWEKVRPDLAPRFKPQKNFDSSRVFMSSDTFSGTRRREGSVCEARSARDGRALAKTEGPSVKGKIVRLLEASRDKVKPTVPRMIFDGRLVNEERKRNFDDYIKEREGELRADWLREELEGRSPGRGVGGYSLGLALRPERAPTREGPSATPTRGQYSNAASCTGDDAAAGVRGSV